MMTNPPARPRPKADPMRTARLMEAVDTLSEEGKRLSEEDRRRMILLLCQVRGVLDLL
jgi:hypothetical protein